MESLLIAVTVISLVLAVTMSVVAWTLLKAERQRAAARIEALEALAFSGEPERQEPARRGRSRPVTARRVQRRCRRPCADQRGLSRPSCRTGTR